MITIRVDGRAISVQEGASVAAALLTNGITTLRTSVSGEPRAALCGMGICFECRVRVNGVEHVRGCQTTVHDGMEVGT